MSKFGFGYLPSKKTAVGSSVSPLYGTPSDHYLPARVNWLGFVHDTLNQGGTNACVGASNAQALHIRAKIRNEANVRLPSWRWIYWAGRRETGHEHLDIGLMPSMAIKAIRDVGFCYEEDFPFEERSVNEAPDWAAARHAFDQRIAESYRITAVGDQRCLEVKKALAYGFPVVFGTLLDYTFDDYKGGLIEPMTGAVTGRHMLCAFGYNEDGIVGINSWGPDWGETWDDDTRATPGGIFRMSWRAVAWDGTDDYWCHTT